MSLGKLAISTLALGNDSTAGNNSGIKNTATGSTIFFNGNVGSESIVLEVTSTGNIVMNSGKGIDFSATANSSGTMTSELLNDYEEGTWTPSLGGTATYSTQVGSYTKIGRVVNVMFEIVVSAIGTGSTYQISGLPFTAAASPSTQFGCLGWNAASTNYTTAILYVQGDTTLRVVGITAATPAASFGNTSLITTGTAVRGTVSYIV